MPDLSKYQPQLPVPVTSGSDLRSLVINFVLSLVLPEAILPELFLAYTVATTGAEDLNLFLGVADKFTNILKNTLQVYKLAKELGFIGSGQQDGLNGIRDALYYDNGSEKIPIVNYLKDIAHYTVQEGDHEGELVTLAQIAYNSYSTLYFKLSDGTYIPLTDALTRLTLAGVTRNYQTIPLGGEGSD